jgi:hypothetical protein
MRKLNLVQLVFFPIGLQILNIFLSNWLRDLAVPEWEILIGNTGLILFLGMMILSVIALSSIYSIYCLIKLYYIITKHISVQDLEKELKRIKESD